MYEAAASCKDIARAPVTNREPHGVITIAGYCYAVRHGMKVQLVNSVSFESLAMTFCSQKMLKLILTNVHYAVSSEKQMVNKRQ